MRKFLLVTASIVCFILAGFSTLMSGFYGVQVKVEVPVTVEKTVETEVLNSEAPEVGVDETIDPDETVEETPIVSEGEGEVEQPGETPDEKDPEEVPEVPGDNENTETDSDVDTNLPEENAPEEQPEAPKTTIENRNLGDVILEALHMNKLGEKNAHILFACTAAVFYILFTICLISAVKCRHRNVDKKPRRGRKHRGKEQPVRSQYYEQQKQKGSNIRF